MKTTIYYYSATGNSLHAAKKISEGIEDCQLVAMASLSGPNKISVEAEQIGLVFPLHYFSVPPLVKEFVERLDIPSTAYVFAVVTCGSPAFSSALSRVKHILAKKDQQLSAGFLVQMLSIYLPLSELPSLDKQAKLLAKADQKLDRILAMVAKQEHHFDGEHIKSLWTAISRYWQKNQLPNSYKKFSCTDSCTGCGLCKKICPVGNIQLESGTVQWLNNCQECLACLHVCPAQSIEFGKRTSGRRRYRHPQITVKELLVK